MKSAMKRLYLLAVAAALSSACTVKEERSGCPCLLNLDFDEVIEAGRYEEAVATVGPSPDLLIEQELLEMEPYRGVGYEVSVPRRMILTSVVCGCEENLFSSTSVRVDTSPVMAFAGSVECADDREQILVKLHKQFCNITLVLEGFHSAEEFPYEIRITAPTNSLSLYDLKPCGGPFSATVKGDLNVNVPRQDPKATITVGLYEDGGEPLFESDISAKLAALGYDWTAVNLADAVVVIDYSHLDCSVEILPWEENGQYRQIDI